MDEKDERKQNKYITDEEAEKLYITEKIINKRKRKWLSRLVTFLFIIVCAAVFGVIARVVFEVSGDKINSLLGKNDGTERTTVDIKQKADISDAPSPTARIYPAVTSTLTPTPGGATPTGQASLTQDENGNNGGVTSTGQPSVTPDDNIANEKDPSGEANEGNGGADISSSPTATPTITPTKAPATPTPRLSDIPTVTSEPDKSEDAPNPTNEAAKDQDSENPAPTGAAEYVAFLKEVMETAEEVAGNVCNIEVITRSTDWFGSENETSEQTTGLLIGQDGVDVLVLADANTIPSGASVKIALGGENHEARIYEEDRDYGLAILAVEIRKIPAEVFEKLEYATLCEEGDIVNAIPVVAFGRANGHENSIAIGAVTSTNNTFSVKDGEIRYFTVDWPDNNKASAFVFNLDGYVCGMITHTYKDNPNDGITNCISLKSLNNVIIKLVNGKKLNVFGIMGDEVPDSVSERTGIESGIFVNEVLGGSPAYLAGMKNGDIITEINGEAIKSMREFMNILYSAEPNTVIRTTYKRMKNNEGIITETVDVIVSEK